MSCKCGTASALASWAETLGSWDEDLSRSEARAKAKSEIIKDAESFFASVRDLEIPKIESAVARTAAQLTIETETLLKGMETIEETDILAAQEEAQALIEELDLEIVSMSKAEKINFSTISQQNEKHGKLVSEIEKTKLEILREKGNLEISTLKVEKMKKDADAASQELAQVIKDLEILKSVESEIPTALGVFEKQQDDAEAELQALKSEDMEISSEISTIQSMLAELENSEKMRELIRREQMAFDLESTLTSKRHDLDFRVSELRPVRDPEDMMQKIEEAEGRIFTLRQLRSAQSEEIDDLREFLKRHEQRTISAIKRLQANSG